MEDQNSQVPIFIQSYIKEIDDTWQKALRGMWSPTILQKLKQLARSLKNSTATLGFYLINTSAIALDDHLASLPSNKSPSIGEQEEINAALGLLKRSVHSERRLFIQKEGDYTLEQLNISELIFLARSQPEETQCVSQQLEHFGFTIHSFSHLPDLIDGLSQMDPTVLIIDTDFLDGENSGIDIARILQANNALKAPVVFLSQDSSLEIRLRAAQAGGGAFITKPIDADNLIDTLYSLFDKQEKHAYRVLIVEDSATLAHFIKLTLEEVGIVTHVVTDPMKVMQPLIEIKPDLILMDVYMPGCTGPQLAQVIRQMDAFVSIPIVYLSAETDLGKQLEAMWLGGDDFLTKPIHPSHLITSVISRVRRYRELRKFMDHDSLTGLLNHNRIKSSLEREIELANRQKLDLSFAILDIDGFKKVNDTYGHLMGDRALKTLSRFLLKNLRVTDYIGRYGGEEFAVILPKTTKDVAVNIISKLHAGFEKVHFQSGDIDFSIRFSCGIAAFPDFPDSEAILKAADDMMYKAKKLGGNQSMLATR